MYTDCHLNVHVSAERADLLSRESFNMKRRHQTMLSFLSTAKKSRRQTGNNNFRNKSYQILRVVLVLKVTVKQYAKAELTTVSVAASVWRTRRPAVFLVKCYSLSSWLHWMYFQGKAERSLDNKSLQQRKCQEFQTNETANYSESKYETDDFVVIRHVCERKVGSWQH